VLEELRQKASFSVTDLERFADCSSMWLFERVVSPRSIDAEVDARLRGTVAHQALFSFFKGLPKRTGAERVQPENLEDALDFLRECLAEAVKAHVRVDVPELERSELEQSLARDLEELVRREAESDSPLVPNRFEVSFGSERSAPELQRGLDLGGFSVSGKIDRIDRDPFRARGMVVDYKSGRTAHSAAEIERASSSGPALLPRAAASLCRDRAAGRRHTRARGDGRAEAPALRAARGRRPGFQKNDWRRTTSGGRSSKRGSRRTAVARIRVRRPHDRAGSPARRGAPSGRCAG
jgi:RecB family exonuclease